MQLTSSNTLRVQSLVSALQKNRLLLFLRDAADVLPPGPEQSPRPNGLGSVAKKSISLYFSFVSLLSNRQRQPHSFFPWRTGILSIVWMENCKKEADNQTRMKCRLAIIKNLPSFDVVFTKVIVICGSSESTPVAYMLQDWSKFEESFQGN
jgi:hypothetical protein